MGIDDIVNQGKKLYGDNKEKVTGFVESDKGEQVSDQVFDSAADLAKKISPDQFDDDIEGARDKADKAIGNDDDIEGARDKADRAIGNDH